MALALVFDSPAAETPEKHWSFQPITRPPLPVTLHATRNTQHASSFTNPIDAFIAAKLAGPRLSLSPPADRRTLIRRVYFDLIGLPPSPEEVRAFESDRSPGAYERLVDKLLASPRHGERWARHWLDVVRFAETTGFEVNTPRPNAWPYRDYVIRAFNEDKPYDQFILEQLAGDVFGEDAATGFLVAGPDDQVKSPDPVLTANQRADELHDIVSTAGSAFLGLTVGCARCHDHKFDPIPQTDYYAIKAVFEGVRHGERKLKTPDAELKERELISRRAQLAEVERQLEELEPLAQAGEVDTNRLRAAVNARRNVERIAPIAARRLRFTTAKTTDAEPCIDELEVYTAEPQPRNVALASAGAKASASSVYPNSEIHRLEHLNDGKLGNSRSWISNERGKGWVELEFPESVNISRIIWGRDREQKFSDRLALEYRIEVATGSNDWRLVASSQDRLPYVAGRKQTAASSVAGLSLDQAAAAKRLGAERAELESRIAELTKAPMIYGGTFPDDPEPTHRLHRGDPMQKREAINAGALSVLPLKFDAASAGSRRRKEAERPRATVEPVRLLTPAATNLTANQSRRLALADWITDPANPLTARVIVNRLWQYHFGEGLVSTPSDFGLNGGRPTHPELLDWLAAELVNPVETLNRSIVKSVGATPGGSPSNDSTIQRFNDSPPPPWSLKHIHRLIVTSATYRQSSAPRQECLAMDADARLLWRFAPRRLEAEPLRDAILAVSGKLDLKMGGPGFSFFEPNDNYVRVYAPRREWTPDTFRRMIYGTVVRQRPDGVFGAFDCPDGGQIAPRRNRSTTPLQALNLLNSSFIMQQAGYFVERLRREAGDEAKAQITRAFALAFGREPSREESGAGLNLIRDQGLPAFCRALFNANEFAYVY
jgi:hypothetical protein